MTEVDRLIDWLQRQLAQVADFIERDTVRLKETPDSHSVQLSINSWRQHHGELLEDLQSIEKGNA